MFLAGENPHITVINITEMVKRLQWREVEPVLDMFSIGQSLSLFVMRFQYREILGYKRNIYIIF